MCNDQIYTHFGSSSFKPEEFTPVRNIDCKPLNSKPSGGLWASCEDEHGWSWWCMHEKFRVCSYANSFSFRLSPDANIAVINTRKLPMLNECIDFEKCQEIGIDVIKYDPDIYYENNGNGDNPDCSLWDCNSIVILNPEVVKPLSSDKFDKGSLMVFFKRRIAREYEEFKRVILKLNAEEVYYRSEEIQFKRDFIRQIQFLAPDDLPFIGEQGIFSLVHPRVPGNILHSLFCFWKSNGSKKFENLETLLMAFINSIDIKPSVLVDADKDYYWNNYNDQYDFLMPEFNESP